MRPQFTALVVATLASLVFKNTALGYIAMRSQGAAPSANPDGNRTYGDVFANGANPGDGADGSLQGDPATFTWSIVPDGTSYYTGSTVESFSTERISAIVSYYDMIFSVPVEEQTPDITNRPWFPGFSEGLEIISNRCGITYVYEPVDDGADCLLSYSSAVGELDPGIAGVRGDLRLAGSSDLFARGLSSTSTGNLHHPEAYIQLGDFNSNASIRFVIMHETMHALAFSHSTVNDSSTQSAVTGAGGNFNGPQFDDICGLHRKYGDFFEKDGGNDSLANATDLGSVDISQNVIIGDDANDTSIAIDEFDFISIDGASDTDFLKFTVVTGGEFRLTLDPRGPTYTNFGTDFSPAFNEDNTQTIVADSLNDLEFRLYDSSGTLVTTVSSQGLGESEVLLTDLSAGEYFAEVTGTTPDPTQNVISTIQAAAAQLYAFSVESTTNRPVAEDLAVTITTETSAPVLLTATDIDGDALTYEVVSDPGNGTLSGTAPALTYSPNPGFTGIDSFTYTANDGALDSATATVTINVFGQPVFLAGYDFDNGAVGLRFAATVQDPDIAASDFAVGEGLLPIIDSSGNALAENTDAEGNVLGTATPLSFGGSRNGLGFTRQGNLDQAITTGDYMAFTLAPESGTEMNLLRFTFRTRIQSLTESANSWSLFSSLDDFETAIAEGETTQVQTWIGNVIDLSAANFQALTEAIEFRLYIFNGRNDSNSSTLFDKFALRGITVETAEIPTGFAAFLRRTPNLSMQLLMATGMAMVSPTGWNTASAETLRRMVKLLPKSRSVTQT